MIVADASVILKWSLPDEPGREKALLLRDRHLSGEVPIVAPELLFYELANVLPRRWGDAAKATELFREICAVGPEKFPFEAPQWIRAMELSAHYRISAYDACYLALAQELRCRLITADERLLAQIKGLPHVVHLEDVR